MVYKFYNFSHALVVNLYRHGYFNKDQIISWSLESSHPDSAGKIVI